MFRAPTTLRSFAALLAVLVPIAIFGAPAAPTLTAPADAARNQTVSPTLSWAAVSGATSYHLQVSTSPDFSSTVYDQSGLTGTSQAISGLAASIINAGTPVNYDNSGGFFNDNERTMIRKDATNTFRSFEGFGDVIYEGTITNPVASNLGGYSWSWNGITGHELYWVMAAYNPGGDTLLGQIHMEDNGQTEYTIGLALSTNFGQSWTYVGDIATPHTKTNMGGGIFIIVNGYFYSYYNGGGLKVARSPVDSVLAAARQLKVTQWMKYTSGAWATSALTSGGTSTVSGDAHGGATVVKSTGTVLLAPSQTGNVGFVLYGSTDGVTAYQSFTVPGTVGKGGPYESFAGTASSGTRTDHFEVGDSFYVFWDNKNPGYNDDHFYRLPIAVYPRNYYWRVSASDAGGAGAWSAARVFTTQATIQSGTVGVGNTPGRFNDRREPAAVLQRVNNGRWVLTFTIPSAASETSTARVGIYDLRGNLVETIADVSLTSGAHSVTIPGAALAPGRYLLRMRAASLDKTVPVAIAR